MLGLWAEKATDDLDIAKSAKFTFLVDSQLQRIQSEITPYFRDILPLIDKWCTLLGNCMKDGSDSSPLTFDAVINILDDFLVTVLEEPHSEMKTVLKEQHSAMEKAHIVPTASKKRIHEDLQTMVNLEAVKKRFKYL